MNRHSVDHAQAGESPDARPLGARAADGRVAFLPARLLEPGLALLVPFAQITEIQTPPYAHDDIMVKTAHNTAWYAFTPESWALVFVPDDATAPCTDCRQSWLDGCAPDCAARIIYDEDAVAALIGTGLTGDWTATQILEARP